MASIDTIMILILLVLLLIGVAVTFAVKLTPRENSVVNFQRYKT